MTKKANFQPVIGFEDNFDRFHIDPLHGPIGITKVESEIIQTEEFKRLKDIKQLGLVHHFYHSATHTRYEHSLGTLHTTWTLFKRVFNNIRIENNTYEVEEETLEKLANYDIMQALRIAGLCHDIGHGPLSHTFENITKEICPDLPDHDKITYTILKKNKFGLDKDLNKLVLAIVNPEKESLKGEPYEEFQFFLHDLVWGDLGSDRIDYLLRDTYMTGLSHRFGLSHLLDSITAIFDPIEKRLYISVDASMKDAVFYFLTTRFYHFQLLANFQKNIQLEAEVKKKIIDYVARESNKDEKKKCESLEKLNNFNDNELMNTLSFTQSNEIEMLASWNISEIFYPIYRFFIYRFAYNQHIRRFYEETIRNHIDDGMKQPIADKLIFYFNIQKGRVPAIPVTMEEYSRGSPQKEDGKPKRIYPQPTLLHEFSPLLQGLAETYLKDTKVTLFAEKAHNIQASFKPKESPSFLCSANIIGTMLEICANEVNQNESKISQCDRLDFLILFFIALTQVKDRYFFYRFRYIQDLVQEVQERVFDSSNEPPYVFNVQQRFYNPAGIQFNHQNVLFNDIFLLKVVRFLETGEMDYWWPLYKPSLSEMYYTLVYSYRLNKKMVNKFIEHYTKVPAYIDILSKIESTLKDIISSRSS